MSNSLRRVNASAFRGRMLKFFALLLFLFLAGEFGQAQAAISLVQHTNKDAGITTTTTLAFPSANTAGNFIAIAIRGGASSSQVFTVSDSNGNTYKKGSQLGFTISAVTLAIYYAENIKGGANTVTVSQTVSGPLRIATSEYSGIATANSVDATASATNQGTAVNSGNATTTVSGDLLLGAAATADTGTWTAGIGYTIRDFVPAEPSTKLIAEDQIQSTAGTAAATATLAASGNWGAVLVAFKPVGGAAGVPASITATAGTPQSATVGTAFAVQMQATVKDSFGSPVNGATVTFAAPGSGASGTFAGGVTTATTNASGVATAAVFTANNTAGGYSVTASVSGVSTPANFSLTNLAGAAASITATAGTPQSATVNTAFAVQFQATVKDSFGNPVNNVTVTFAAPGSGASGTFAGGVTTATTNASGAATAAAFTANTTAGAYAVTASVSGVGSSASFSLTNLAGAAASVAATAGTPQSATISTAYSVQFQATVTDSFNNPVNGVTVTFNAPASGASGTFAGGVKTATTNASGIATAAVFTANTTAGAYTLTATVSGVSSPANFSLTNLAGAPASITATAGTPQSASINTAFTTQFQATVKDSFGNPVSSVTVTFTAPGSGASGTFAGGVNTATTNASGVATAAVFTANGTAGAYTVTASAPGVASPANFSLTNLGNPPANIAATAGTPQSATINTAFAVQFQVTVTDSGNNPVNGVTVTFNAPGSGASGTFAGGVNTAVTNASGIATAAVFTANGTAGSYTVTATVSGVASPANFSLTNLPGPAASITATAGTPQSATVGTAFTTQFQVIVKDAGGNPVNGVTVTFTAPGSGASGAFAGGLNTATTNASGIATAAVFTANNTAGSYTVTASVSGVAGTANFSLTNLAGAAASITATAGTPQSTAVSTAFPTQLQATVKDSFGNPVNAVTVTFTAPTSGASGTFAGGVNTATTNASGVATAAVFTANSTVGGPYTVTASVSGVGTSASFSLTNVTGTPASIAATAGTPQSATVAAAYATAFQVTVKDASNNPVNGVTVTFTAPATGASGTFAGGVTTATTNSSGIATAAAFTANNTAGAYTVTASVSGVSTSASFSLTNQAGPAATITATAGTPQSATVNTAFAIQPQATVVDSFSNPVNGVTVTFAAPGSGASGTFAGGVNTATTNTSGVATAPVFTANGATGSYTVTASVSGVSTPANYSLTNTASVAANIVFVQHTNKDAGATTSSTLAFASANTAGNFIVVSIRGGNSNTQVFSVSDSNGNTYKKASQLSFNPSAVTLAVYYAENIKGGSNTVTISMSVSGPLRFTMSEYSGVATSSSSDGAVAASNQGTAANSGNLTTTANGDLLFGAIGTADAGTYTAGTGYNIRDFVPAEPNTKLIDEDQVQSAAGSASATATLAASSNWGAILAAFKAAGGGGGPVPSITSLSQTSGAVGVQVTITGTNFGATQGTSSVTFNGTTATVSNWSASSIITTVPAGAATGPVVVTVNGVQSNGVTFTVVPAPSISSLSPNSGPIGIAVTISGANFGSSQGSSTITFNGLSAGTATSWSAASILVNVPNGATTGNVVVTVLGTPSNAVAFTVTSSGPSISSLSLTQGPVGAGFTINGSSFGSTQGTSTATLNGAPLTVTSWVTNMINVTVPSGATSGNVIVTVSGVQSNGLAFTVTPPPAITSIAPTSGPIGTNVVITGTNFGPTVGTIQSYVTFNGIQTRASNWSNTSITAPVPSGATTGNVLVYVGGVPSNGVTFTVTPPPSITSLTPNFGPVGTSVTIAGANFGASQGSSTVTFNGTPATPASWSASSIVVPVPSGATSGNVVVTESGVQSNGVNFTVTSGSGNVSLVQHTSVDAGTTTSASLAFPSANTAGNWIAVCVRAGTTTSTTFTITDSNGNTYKQAYQFSLSAASVVFATYYAENIKGGANTVTVSDTQSGPLRFAILEYSGIATSNSPDATPVATSGIGTTANSGSLTTGANGDLLLGMVVTANTATFTSGSGYTIRDFVPAEPNTKLITEDQIQASAGTVSASASIAASDNWGAGLAAFRSISGTALPITVTVSPHTASVPTGYGTQVFTVTVANDFQNKGVTWALSGAGCSGSACGTITPGSNFSVTYNAPANVPSPATVTLTATSVTDNTKSDSATITITQGVLTVILSPKRAAVTLSASQTVQFTANVYNDPSNSGVTYQVDGNNGGNATTGTISSTGLFTPGTQAAPHTVTAFSNANASVSASAPVAVTDLTGVYTYHNDNARTGQNVQEYSLTPATVNSSSFGQLFSCPVDGYLYATPLWVAHLNIAGGVHNVLFISTEHDSVYAFDADSPSCVQYWQVNFLGNGVTTSHPSDYGGNADIVPEDGITSTPVIDPATNTLYVVPNTRETVGTVNGQVCSTSSPCYVHRLHALDLITGAEKFGGPVVITAHNFDPYRHLQRPALLFANSTVYINFGSHGDQNPYEGWLMGYDPGTLAQKFALPTSVPTSNNRAGVWQSGAGPATDASGNVYFSTGNGFYDGSSNWGDTALKVSPTGSILDWFTPFNQSTFNANDIDLASSGIIILPDAVGSAAHPHLAIATGKVAILYLLDIGTPAPGGTTMGKFNSSTNNDVQEVVPVPPPNTTLLDGGNYGIPAYWNSNIYTTGQNFPLSQFTIANGVIATPQSSKSTNMFPPRGGIPVVSANNNTGGVVWIIDYTGWQNNTPAILDAYDATNLGALLYSSPSSGTGSIAPAVKFTTPIVANGRVYVGGQYSFSVFGPLP